MLAYVRDHLRAWESTDFRIPTTVVDQVLDELNSLERSRSDRNWCAPCSGVGERPSAAAGSRRSNEKRGYM